ncbi:hypothetical protein QQZ08_008775 [Neonectria magnoliae]|uniref:Methyltransferase domain-containing protein n=1 Tax=Neonectria magnoliae TaxID=2732573 RepID=A0ABR1HT73_9HYPO
MSDYYDDHDSGAPTEPSSVASPTGPNNREPPPPVEENGRLYHPRGRYHFPSDQAEKDRLNLQHEAWLLTFNGELGLCPKIREMGHNVLDIGTGTGVWAIDYALKHKGSMVTGLDITGHPSPGPMNYKLEVDDCEDQDWQWLGNIDFVFARAMTGCFETMEYIVDQAKFHLRPNGWLEIQGLEGLCLRLFTQQLNWTREQVLEFCSRARQQLKDRNIHAYLPM